MATAITGALSALRVLCVFDGSQQQTQPAAASTGGAGLQSLLQQASPLSILHPWRRWQDKNAYGEPVEKRMVAFPARVKYDPNLVAPEWFRWLHKTRHDPPTPDELRQCAPCAPAHWPDP